MGKTCHVTDADGVSVGREYDGDRIGQPLDSPDLRRRRREYHVDIHADQLGGKLGQLIDRFRPAKFEGNIPAFEVAKLAQARPQRLYAFGLGWWEPQPQEPDPRNVRALRPRRPRPHHRAADQRDDLAPRDHSITSSARARSVAGTSRPSVLAVLRFRIISIFVACCTGTSVGFSPCKMRPVQIPAWRCDSATLPPS